MGNPHRARYNKRIEPMRGSVITLALFSDAGRGFGGGWRWDLRGHPDDHTDSRAWHIQSLSLRGFNLGLGLQKA